MTVSSVQTKRGFVSVARVVLDVSVSLSIVAGALTLAYQSFGSRSSAATRPRQLPVPAQTLPLDGASLIGDPSADAVMLEFSDFECPYCGKFSVEILPILKERYIERGKLLLAFRNLPLKIHANAQGAALAAKCADEQRRFASFHDLLFANQRALGKQDLDTYARTAGLNQESYGSCIERSGPDRLKSDTDLAASLGITATPSFLIGTKAPGGIVVKKTIMGAAPSGDFLAAIDDVLSARR